jgi:SAM-dependent MidA family methyltransferase
LGPLPFDQFVDAALYHPEAGFYAGSTGAGRGADFLTSPELGPLFGAVVARALDSWWDELDRPDPFVVVEAGAGVGTLARDVFGATPRCSSALHYLLVERSPELRRRQPERLRLEPAGLALGPMQAATDPDEARVPTQGDGPVAASLSELPADPFVGVILANELLDNLPFLLLERGPRGWCEVRVGESGGELVEVLVPAAPELDAEAVRRAPDAPDHARIPIQNATAAWLRAALGLVRQGRVTVLDYASDTPGMAARPWTEWLRTYRGHRPGRPPLCDAGTQDITCEVAIDQVEAVRPVSSDSSQAEFLEAHGLRVLAEEAGAAWRERAHVGDLEAVRARSRAIEAAALVDPAGLGAFRILEWVVG